MKFQPEVAFVDKNKKEIAPQAKVRKRQKTWNEQIWDVLKVIYKIIVGVAKWAFNLRGILMAVPVALVALRLAAWNMVKLPEEVGINLLASGEYQYMISRGLAVMGPLVVTAVCLLMMLLSRRTIYPWLISIFSLVLPLLIWVTNVFPG